MSKTLAELKSDVLELVKRPDLITAVELHTKNAILKAHNADYFIRDLYENALTFAVSAPQYSLEPKLILPRWRKTKYINVIDSVTLQPTKQLTPIVIENFVDSYSYIRDYVWYEAGAQLQIRASGGEQYFGFGCYLYPDTTLANPSWIADEFPYAIQYEAARTLFKTIGYDEQSAAMEKLVAEAMAEVKMVGLATIGD